MSRDEDLFAEAAELPASERAAFLERACAGDAALRARVEALLSGHDAAYSFLRTPLGTRDIAAAEETVGTRIGRYKLLEKIGEGGCGTVWVAEQAEPVRRRVALKVIKLGMDTREVVARFEAERQALALMDHPNIAHVFDGGSTANGRPFFVMELVRGVPITRYCDEAKLTPNQRLELFIAVCQAVQHAHQKGIIHRDLKPSNIIVTVNDGVAVPKVIDFGIAKAMRGPLTDKTVYTAFSQFIGTPVYMSPEQADLTSVDIDTRSDIYSLGVLLYELLTGAPPFDPKTLLTGGVDEIRRIIREVEPARPSTRVATLAEVDRTTLGRQRSLAANELSVALRGDLDWIVMRCLEKDRARRYETANALVMDLRRHLANEPVTARPPSAAYRLHKAFQRHRLAFAAGTVVLVSLIAGLAVSTLALTREKKARQEARRAEQLGADARQNAERLLTYIVSDLGEDLDQLGQLPTLRNLNGQVLKYYEQLNPALHTRETRAGLALARTGIASVGWFNTDRFTELRLGYPEARKRFEEALLAMEELEKSGPLTPFIRVAYAGVLWGLTGQRYSEGRRQLGLPLLVKAEGLLKPILADPQWGNWADHFTAKVILGRGFMANGSSAAEQRRTAVAEYQRALARAEERDKRGLTTRRSGLLAAEIRWRLGSEMVQSGAKGGGAILVEAQKQLRELLAREPHLVAATTVLANTNYQLAVLSLRAWQLDEWTNILDEGVQQFELAAKSDPNGWGRNGFFVNALLARASGRWRGGDFPGIEADLQKALHWLLQPFSPPGNRRQLLAGRFHLARLYAATQRDAESDEQLVAAQSVAQQMAVEQPWLTPKQLLTREVADKLERCKVEAERLNWRAVRGEAESILKAGNVSPAEGDRETEPDNNLSTAHFHLMRAAFETGDYTTARRELEAWAPQTELSRPNWAINSKFLRIQDLLTRLHVLARAGELAEARAELARIWPDAEKVFETGREHLFVQVEYARALSIRAEVENADRATKRAWLERAAGWLRPAATAGRLTRYEREVLMHRIEQQMDSTSDL